MESHHFLTALADGRVGQAGVMKDEGSTMSRFSMPSD